MLEKIRLIWITNDILCKNVIRTIIVNDSYNYKTENIFLEAQYSDD